MNRYFCRDKELRTRESPLRLGGNPHARRCSCPCCARPDLAGSPFGRFPTPGAPSPRYPQAGALIPRLKGNRWPRGDAHTLSHDQTYAFIVIPARVRVPFRHSRGRHSRVPLRHSRVPFRHPRTREPRAIKTTVPSRPSPTPVRYRGNGVLCFTLGSRVRGNSRGRGNPDSRVINPDIKTTVSLEGRVRVLLLENLLIQISPTRVNPFDQIKLPISSRWPETSATMRSGSLARRRTDRH